MSAASREFRDGWTLVFACAVGFGLGGSGLPFYTSGVFADALLVQFHWSMAALHSASLIIALVSLGCAPLAGLLTDRFGSRRVAIPAMMFFGLSFALLSLQDGSYPTFVLLWVLVAVAGAGTLPLVWSRAIAGRFQAGRGLALGITLLGTGMTSFIAPTLAAQLIAWGGWRSAYIAMGAGSMVISIPILIAFLHEKPGEALAVAAPAHGLSLSDAIRTWRFWALFLSLFCVTLTVSGFISNFVRMMTLHGFVRTDAAWIAGTTGIFVILGRLGCGYLLDRWHGPWVGAAFFASVPVACLLMADPDLGRVRAIVAAALIGLGAAAELDIIPYLVSRYFGLRKLGSILGIITLAFTSGAGFGPIAFASVFDRTGSYHSVLFGAVIVSLLGGMFVVGLGVYPRWDAAAEPPPIVPDR